MKTGDVTILLDQSRKTGYVQVGIPIRVAVTRDGRRVSRLANLPWPNELVQMNEARNMEWAKSEQSLGIHLDNIGANGSEIVVVTHLIDPSDFTPEEFELKIRKFLKELEDYRLGKVHEKVSEELLELNLPDASLSERQLQVLSKIATELSANYGEPFDGKTWEIKSRNGKTPVRLKVFIRVKDLIY